MEKTRPIGVYIKVNNANEIIAVGSDIFINDLNNWIKIDEGEGDNYSHAQSQYFKKALVDDYGNFNYKYINGKVLEV